MRWRGENANEWQHAPHHELECVSGVGQIRIAPAMHPRCARVEARGAERSPHSTSPGELRAHGASKKSVATGQCVPSTHVDHQCVVKRPCWCLGTDENTIVMAPASVMAAAQITATVKPSNVSGDGRQVLEESRQSARG